MEKRIIIAEKILGANEKLAEQNRALFDLAGVYAVNLMASPGAGKTSVILKTLAALVERYAIAVVDGDVASSIDADKAAQAGATAVQINTGGECHLDAVMLQSALKELDLNNLHLLIVENVGNLICPASFPLGTHLNVLIASIPEGYDKPYKYPGMYQGVDVLLINKIDLLPYIDFDMAYFQAGVQMLNPQVKTFPLSCKTGEGVEAWVEFLVEKIESVKR